MSDVEDQCAQYLEELSRLNRGVTWVVKPMECYLDPLSRWIVLGCKNHGEPTQGAWLRLDWERIPPDFFPWIAQNLPGRMVKLRDFASPTEVGVIWHVGLNEITFEWDTL